VCFICFRWLLCPRRVSICTTHRCSIDLTHSTIASTDGNVRIHFNSSMHQPARKQYRQTFHLFHLIHSHGSAVGKPLPYRKGTNTRYYTWRKWCIWEGSNRSDNKEEQPKGSRLALLVTKASDVSSGNWKSGLELKILKGQAATVASIFSPMVECFYQAYIPPQNSLHSGTSIRSTDSLCMQLIWRLFFRFRKYFTGFQGI